MTLSPDAPPDPTGAEVRTRSEKRPVDREVRIKICGVRTAADVAAVNLLLPDYVGFVFASGSKRFVISRQAEDLVRALDGRITPVGVFVDASLSDVAAAVRRGIVRMVQLHGSENEAFVSALRREVGVPIVKAFSMDDDDVLERAERSAADYILLDAGRGGTGRTFDWSRARRLERPFFLAGGLNADNVGAALRDLRPFAVDMSTGVETDGAKDPEKMRAAIEAVRGRAVRETRRETDR